MPRDFFDFTPKQQKVVMVVMTAGCPQSGVLALLGGATRCFLGRHLQGYSLLDYGRSLMSDCYNFTFDWFSNNVPVWINLLGHLAGKPGVRFLEIGVYEGRSTIWLLENILAHETSSVDCVDHFIPFSAPWYPPGVSTNYEERFDQNIQLACGEKKVRKIKGFSQEILWKLPPSSYDGIYVDGSHDAPDVLEDAVVSFKLLKPGGILIFDDYEWNAYSDPWRLPRIAVDAFLHVYRHRYDLLHKSYQVALRKK